jgi:hypothetical protein
LVDGIEKLETQMDIGQGGNERVDLWAWKIPKEYDVSRTSYYDHYNIQDEEKPYIHMIGHINMECYSLRFAIMKESDGKFKAIIFDIDMDNYADMRNGDKFMGKHKDRLVKMIPKIQEEYAKTEKANLALVDQVKSAVKAKNRLSSKIKKALNRLKKDEKAVIDKYLACKKMDNVV